MLLHRKYNVKREDINSLSQLPDGVRIPLTGGYFAIVDFVDASEVLKISWYCEKAKNNNKYAVNRFSGIRLHRFIANRMGLEIEQYVDHRDLNGLNCRRSNIRVATHQQNNANTGLRKHNTSGRKGVSWDVVRSAWKSNIRVNNKTIFLGRYLNIKEAADAYDAAALKYFGDFALTNAEISRRKDQQLTSASTT